MTNNSSIAVIQFPGSNCDQDCIVGLDRYFGLKAHAVWYQNPIPKNTQGIILPGGFSFGDYLAAGSLAAFSLIMEEIKAAAKHGTPILGICNGFQILTRSGLLPGALLGNENLQFNCQPTTLKVGKGASAYHQIKDNLQIPIAHKEGRYFAPTQQLKTMHDQGQIVFTYDDNPNGSVDDIAGICSPDGRILGMMPHPERALSQLVGTSQDCIAILSAFLSLCG